VQSRPFSSLPHVKTGEDQACPEPAEKVRVNDLRDAASVADRYLNAQGTHSEGQYRLTLDELAWLAAHASRLSATRLELLRSLQTALPGADGELKELLTDIIIMESRLAGRGERLQVLLAELKDDSPPDGVSVDQQRLREAIVEILEAAARVETAAEGSP